MSTIAASGDDDEDWRGGIDRYLEQLSDEEREELAKAVQGVRLNRTGFDGDS
ncbi:hypothetical protein [Ruania albidiflava]|uniref:hypothetical protein n=1 Tax=Ruania albidiflava TaxID=366586 RepID=UPI0003B56D13|nr:hypothetical protein [Ruania albidiflava]